MLYLLAIKIDFEINVGDIMRIAVRSLFLLLIVIVLVNCSGKSAQQYYDSGMANIKDGKYNEALTDFRTLIKEYPDDNLVANAYFETAKIYHGKLIKDLPLKESSDKAVRSYQIVANKYPDSPLAPNALFMVGFIEANELRQFGKAKETYSKFLQKYPDNELAKSAQAELDNLGVSAEEILKKNLKEE